MQIERIIILLGILSLWGCTPAEQKAIADLKLDDLWQQPRVAVAGQVSNQERCTIVNQEQSLSREDYTELTKTFLAQPMRSIPESRLHEVAGSPYCNLPEGVRANGTTFQRRAYRLEFDDSGLLVVAFVDRNSLVGWGFLVQKPE